MKMTQEFILWGNCTNKCKFCWQCKKADPEISLNEQEMIDCISAVNQRLNTINDGDDVLLVGGEILAPYYDSVNNALYHLFHKCAELVKSNKIRYLYVNTNLLYFKITNLENLLLAFNNLYDRLKFTTSYDVYGRFEENKESLFITNIDYIQRTFPNVNIVVNTIITKQLVDYDLEKIFELQTIYPVIKYINFIPYVPVQNDRSMDITFRDIISVLIKLEKKFPGYIQHYIDDLDLNQDKVLYEYRKSSGFTECTSKYLPCHHNENFTKVLNGECYICKLKEIFR